MKLRRVKYYVWLGLSLVFLSSSCLKRAIVRPDSEEVPKSDYVEVTLNSGEKKVLKNVKVYTDSLEGEHRGEIVQITFDTIKTVEVVNRDYGKFLTYYLIGGAVVGAVLFYSLHGLEGPLFD